MGLKQCQDSTYEEVGLSKTITLIHIKTPMHFPHFHHLPMPQAATPENAWPPFVVYGIIPGSHIHPVGKEEWVLSCGSEGESRQTHTFYRDRQRVRENSVPGQGLKEP